MPRTDTSFSKDMNTYGNVGETWFMHKLKQSPKTIDVIDTSDIEQLRPYDIDMIQVKTNEPISIDTITEIYKSGSILDDSRYIAYEVKTDTQIGTTRNIAYEVMSNTKVGCTARTMANYIVYTGISVDGQINEAYLIHTWKLKKYVLENFSKINRKDGMKSVFMNHTQDRTAILLINIDILLKGNIATRIL